ncbi:hypothetical protein ABIB27_002392 [Arthrobacter sp. UYEF21]
MGGRYGWELAAREGKGIGQRVRGQKLKLAYKQERTG